MEEYEEKRSDRVTAHAKIAHRVRGPWSLVPSPHLESGPEPIIDSNLQRTWHVNRVSISANRSLSFGQTQ
jgi:hypothetical protein